MAEIGIEANEGAAGVATRRFAAIRGAINPTTLVALLLVAILVFLVANPLFQLVKQSFTKTSDHSFTFANYVTAFGRPRYVQALINSLELGAVAAAIAGFIRRIQRFGHEAFVPGGNRPVIELAGRGLRRGDQPWHA